MLRTYKSKKETGGGLDPKDVLLTMDEKSTAFDAFYIQNIKETKREFSCVGSSKYYGVASNKVRKKKYVRRIVKDAEQSRDSTSRSTFLTPDKSIHVNKALDPFDQLLNSSPQIEKPNVKEAPDMFDLLLGLTPKIENPIDNVTLEMSDHLLKSSPMTDRPTSDLSNKVPFHKGRGKSHIRKKMTKKKVNYFNGDSTDSDKENSNGNSDVTDIGAHRLFIEKENNLDLKSCDDSIDNIVKNMSLLNNIKTANNEIDNFPMPNRKDSMYNVHRLSRGLLRNSLKSSTPFREKHRGKSMFKFSPISTKDLEAKPDCEILEKRYMKNDSIIFVNNDDMELPKISQESGQSSPIIPIKKSLFNSMKTNLQESLVPVDKSKSNVIIEQNLSKSFTEKEESSFLVNETKPYLSIENKSIDIKVSDNVKSSNNNEPLLKSLAIECSMTNKPFLGFSKVNVSSDGYNNQFVPDNLSFDKNETGNSSLSNLQYSQNDSMYDTCNSDESCLKCTGDEESLDICNYDQSSAMDNIGNEPIVKLEKMNNSVFANYYRKITDFESIIEVNQNTNNSYNDVSNNNSQVSIDFEGQDQSDNAFEQLQDKETDFEDNSSNNSNSSDQSYIPEDISSDDSSVKSDSNDDDKCVSYVTTRRKIKTLLDSDDFFSNVSIDCDKTVFSNKVTLHENPDHNVCNSQIEYAVEASSKLLNEEIVNYVQSKEAADSTQEIDTDAIINTTAVPTNTTQEINAGEIRKSSIQFTDPNIGVISKVATRQSSETKDKEPCRSSENSCVFDVTKCESEPKTGIILQPGKKWERSLSIYKRMTMLNNHFDHSVLDEEPLNSKGRKYRQSVITTMEMQENQGLLHNESLNSRRSTFVSKPCRSTIKIVKELNSTCVSLCSTTVYDDLKGKLLQLSLRT